MASKHTYAIDIFVIVNVFVFFVFSFSHFLNNLGPYLIQK